MNLRIIGIQLIGRIDFEEEIKASVCLGRPCSRTPPPVFASARHAGPDFRGISSSPESSSRSVTLVEVAPLCELRLLYLVTWKLWVACKLVFGLWDVVERLSERRVASCLGSRKQVGWLLQFCLRLFLIYLYLSLPNTTKDILCLSLPRSDLANNQGEY